MFALMVITAATIYARVNPDDHSPRIKAPEDAMLLAKPIIDFQAMIATARALAGENSSLQQIIADLRASDDRGHIPGIGRAVGYVAPGASESYSIAYRGGELAELTVRGDSSTELELAVLDEYDHSGGRLRSVKAERLILNPLPSGSRVTAASVLSSVGSKPAVCKPNASAIVKQPAWAAAISSSGLVPFSFSKRVLNE
jgi:hypothetical protein